MTLCSFIALLDICGRHLRNILGRVGTVIMAQRTNPNDFRDFRPPTFENRGVEG